MGKAKRQRTKNRLHPYAQKGMEVDSKTSDKPKPKTRGDIEKEHHDEKRKFRAIEDDYRRRMKKFNKKVPSEAKERKDLLLELKSKKSEMEARHKREIQELIDAKQDKEETVTKEVEMTN